MNVHFLQSPWKFKKRKEWVDPMYMYISCKLHGNLKNGNNVCVFLTYAHMVCVRSNSYIYPTSYNKQQIIGAEIKST